MRPLRRFDVRPAIPESLAALPQLATNLHWAWDRPLVRLFERIWPGWTAASAHPAHMVRTTTAERYAELAADPAIVGDVAAAASRLTTALDGPTWFAARDDTPLRSVAYFSPEFGVTEALPQYSGGLGVLAGDHLKACSDLGVPLVGVGLLYTEGYFRQALDADGWQQESTVDLDPASLGLTDTGVRVTIDLAGDDVSAAVWRADVGTIALFLLDTDVDGNSPDGVAVTDRLYGGDSHHRLRQEIVLGIGGVRALRALGYEPDVFHTNEGHAGFLGLERIREHVAGGMTFSAAVEAVRGGGLFTTHTPVPAGIDRFDRALFERYFTAFAAECGVSIDELFAIGVSPDDTPNGHDDGNDNDDDDNDAGNGNGNGDAEPPFNMAVMGLRLAARSNGVAELHGSVAREMFHPLWPQIEPSQVPITAVTNGVHGRSWTSIRVDSMLSRVIGDDWSLADAERWRAITTVDPAEIGDTLAAGRRGLVRFVRDRLGNGILNPDVLTIGFARRFATYKRATLLLSQPERLLELIGDPDRPVQFVFAGKAHPADEPGKRLIQEIEQFARRANVRHRFVFLTDYSMAIAREMYHGCDVWLNTPRRPHEACGTSGMKAALNGALNCSILDGWWDECYEPGIGWAIDSAEDDPDLARRDERECASLFSVLEDEVVPTFYDRGADGLPARWIEMVQAAWAALGPQVTAQRMVRDYTTRLYEPAAADSRALAADGGAVAVELADWRNRARAAWPQVAISELDVDTDEADAGAQRDVAASVELGALDPADVRVDVVHGTVGTDGSFAGAPTTAPMTPGDDGRYRATISLHAPGSYGVTVRVLPHHRALPSDFDLGLAAWA